MKQDKVRETAEILQRGLQANPYDPDLKVALGELLFRQGKIQEAEQIFVDSHQLPRSQCALLPRPGRAIGCGRDESSSALADRARS